MGALLREILGHPEKPREQLPGQPVRPLARISQAGAGREGGNVCPPTRFQMRWVPGVGGWARGLQGVLTWDPKAGHSADGSRVVRSHGKVETSEAWRPQVSPGRGRSRSRSSAKAAWDSRKPRARDVGHHHGEKGRLSSGGATAPSAPGRRQRGGGSQEAASWNPSFPFCPAQVCPLPPSVPSR